MSICVVLPLFVLALVNLALTHVQEEPTEFLPKPEALIRSDDVIKVPLESGATLYTDNKVSNSNFLQMAII